MDIIRILQVIVAIALIALVMLQERSSGLGGAFGGGNESFARRDVVWKKLFIT